MKKYEVSVTRIGYAHTTIEVEAESEEQAEQKAIDMAGNYDFSEHDADYECNGVTIVEPDDDPADHVAADDPAQEVYASYSEDMRKAVAYINRQLEPEDKTIICAKVDKNFKQHMNPAYGIDDGKIIDLLEEYGQDNDLPEGWWEAECEMDDIVLLIQFEN